MSTIKIFMIRHGNTFESSKEAYYVGSKIDLSLTKQGVLQAKEIGKYFSNHKIDAIYSGGLKRQVETANQIKKIGNIDVDIVKTNALNEINYGNWEGMKSEDIIKQHPQEFCGWSKKGEFADTFEDDFVTRQKLLRLWFESLLEQDIKKVIAVSSNGLMKMVLSLTKSWDKIVGDSKLEEFKVRTGHFCEIDLHVDETLNIVAWNESPCVHHS